MRILDRYINKSIISVFVFTLLTFCFLYLMIDVTTQLDEFIDRKIPIDILIKYYIYYMPVILSQPITSVACLIAVLFTFSGLNNNNEIIAMRASGLHFWKITRPAICFGLLVSVFIFGLNERLVPKATQITKQIRDDHMVLLVDRMRKKKEDIRNLTFYGLKNRLYHVQSFNPQSNELNGITIIEHDENQDVRQKIVALKGVWTGLAWNFYRCQVISFAGSDINTPLKMRLHKEKMMDIEETPEDFMKQHINISSMNIKQLKNYINRFSGSGATNALNDMRVDLHQKIAYPFGTFVIVLLGLPFALMLRGRKGTTFLSIGLAFGFGFLYYIANAVALAFGKSGVLDPIIAAWITPILFTIIAITIIESDFAN